MVIVFLFLVLVLSILLAIEPNNFKKSYSWICEKDEQTSINLTNVFDFIGLCLNYGVFDMCLYYIYYAKIYSKATLNVNELILTPFSPFDVLYIAYLPF